MTFEEIAEECGYTCYKYDGRCNAVVPHTAVKTELQAFAELLDEILQPDARGLIKDKDYGMMTNRMDVIVWYRAQP